MRTAPKRVYASSLAAVPAWMPRLISPKPVLSEAEPRVRSGSAGRSCCYQLGGSKAAWLGKRATAVFCPKRCPECGHKVRQTYCDVCGYDLIEQSRDKPLYGPPSRGKALADPVRLRLMSLIASHPGGEACVCDLNEAFDLSQPTISHHLKVLHEAGLLDRDKRGVWVYYRARPEALASLGTLIGSPEPAPAA